MNAKDVSVVIPSMLRPELRGAVASVEAQTIGRERIEVIVVVDQPETLETRATAKSLASQVDVLVFTGGGFRGGGARQYGVSLASAPWVAFLDDDDWWAPEKLELQLAAARTATSPERTVVSCRAIEVGSDGNRSDPVPSRTIGQEPVADYLFVGRGPTPGRSSIFTSSLLVSAKLAREIPWRKGLKRHQDWDWLIAVDVAQGTRIVQLPQALLYYAVGSQNSVSARPDWPDSIQWLRERQHEMSRRATTDFLAGQVLRYALQARSLRGAWAAAAAIARNRTAPYVQSVALGLAGIVPRHRLERLFFVVARFPRLSSAQTRSEGK